jgi:hypothetical protein
MMRRLAGTAALVAGAFVRVAAAQDVQPEPLSRLDARYRIQIDALIDSARQAGLPWGAVRSKALEGVNLKADAPRIVIVVRQYYASLVKSRAVLGPLSDTDIETGASALSAGLRPEDLALFRPAVAGRSPAHALVYLSDLISARHGVPREDAVTAFAKLWKDGAGDSDFDGLWRGIDQDILSGVNPKAALQNRVRSLPARSVRPPEQDEENPHS